MEIRITKKELVDALGRVVGVLSANPTIPALNHVLVEAGENYLQVTGTDLEVTVTTRIPQSPKGKGKILVPGRKLFDLARESGESEIILQAEKNNRLRFMQNNLNVCLVGLKTDDFPAVMTTGESAGFSVPSQALKKGISLTRPVVFVNENKPNISGILLTTEEGWFTMVSTDTKRLSLYRSKTNISREVNFILPVKAAEMIRTAWGEKENIEIRATENQASFSGAGTEIICQLIKASFPNYRQVIPDEADLTKIELSREQFMSALKRINLIVSAGRNVAGLAFSEGGLEITGETSGVGEGREKIEAEYHGETREINFQPEFLVEGLKNIEEEICLFHLNPDTEKPSMLTNKSDKNYLYLIMPIKS